MERTPDPTVLHRARAASARGRAIAVAVLAAAALAACASGRGDGSRSADGARAAPTRHVLRLPGYAPIEIVNEGAVARRVVQAPPDRTWAVLGGVYVQLDIPVAVSDAAELQLGNAGYSANRVDGARMNRYVDCGANLSGPLANLHQVTLTVVTQLAPAEEGGTEVVTFLDAYAKPRSVSGNPIHCQSRGRLEALIGERIAEALGVGP